MNNLSQCRHELTNIGIFGDKKYSGGCLKFSISAAHVNVSKSTHRKVWNEDLNRRGQGRQ